MNLPRVAVLVALTAVVSLAPSTNSPAQRAAAAPSSLVFARTADPPGRHHTLQLLNLRTGAVEELFKPSRPIFDVAVSPDGDEVAYVSTSRSGDQIRIVGTDGNGDRQLFTDSLIFDQLSWTPDGSQLVYSGGPFDRRGARQQKRSEIYSVATDGGEPTRLTKDDRADYDPSVTPDGERIVFSRNAQLPEGGDAPRLDLHSMAIDGTDITPITNTAADEIEAEVSPDGRRIVFVKDLNSVLPDDSKQRRRFLIQVVDIDGSNRVTVERGRGNEDHPTWSPDSKRILFTSDRDDRKPVDDYYREQLFTAKADGTGVKERSRSPFTDTLPSYVP